MYIKKSEIEQILTIMNEFSDARNFFLKFENSNGIGSSLALQIEVDVREYPSIVEIEITDVKDW